MHSSARSSRELRLQRLKEQSEKKKVPPEFPEPFAKTLTKTNSSDPSKEPFNYSQKQTDDNNKVANKSNKKNICDLSNLGLKSLENVMLTREIVIMNLSKNKLKAIPDEIISSCPCIIELNLSENYIEKLHDDIQNLAELQILDLSNNGITYVTQLKNNLKLKKLFLKRNRLKTIEYLNQNRELEVLDYSENEVTTLNECEYNLPTSIVEFNLSGNQIKSILAPRTLFCLSKLERLNFSENPFTKTLSSNKIDIVHFILSLLIDCSLKFVNDKKLTHTDFK